MTDLVVWRDGQVVGVLTEARGRMAFTYADTSQPMVSVALAGRTAPYRDDRARPYFAGLLPEGEARRVIAYDLGLGNEGGADLDMLAAIGRDCAGALSILPDGSEPRPDTPTEPDQALDDDDVADLLQRLPNQPLGISGRVRISLPGVQPKLGLVRRPDGGWALPADGSPSTHILKPAIAYLPGSVESEALCERVARELDLAAAETEIVVFDGRPVLVSTRFDREPHPDGTVGRVHQEDGCQALSIPGDRPHRKYQRNGTGPSYAALAEVLDRWSDRSSLIDLLGHVVLNVVVGNADHHAKNVSFLHAADGASVRLAPAYDVMNTTGFIDLDGRPLVSSTLGLYVAGVDRLEAVTTEHLVDEAVSWGLRPVDAESAVNDLLDRFPSAVDAAADAVPDAAPRLVDLLLGRVADIRGS